MFTTFLQPQRTDIRFCRYCGHGVEVRPPGSGDDHQRAICPNCGTIHYVNPLVVVGTVPVLDDGRVLLCKRAIEPRLGFWTLPAGFMELGETLEQGALRETVEEAGAKIEMLSLFSVISVSRVSQVHVYFRARVLQELFEPGPETLQVQLVTQDQVPWDDIAFRTVKETLRCFFADQRNNRFGIHQFDVP